MLLLDMPADDIPQDSVLENLFREQLKHCQASNDDLKQYERLPRGHADRTYQNLLRIANNRIREAQFKKITGNKQNNAEFSQLKPPPVINGENIEAVTKVIHVPMLPTIKTVPNLLSNIGHSHPNNSVLKISSTDIKVKRDTCKVVPNLRQDHLHDSPLIIPDDLHKADLHTLQGRANQRVLRPVNIGMLANAAMEAVADMCTQAPVSTGRGAHVRAKLPVFTSRHGSCWNN